jgi:RNAse (barnase) inhibitor barstar
MTLRLVIDGATMRNIDDVYDAVSRLPGVPDWFGRNLNALAELAYFVSEPLSIQVVRNQALRSNFGKVAHDALIETLVVIRVSENDDAGWQPVTLQIQEYD